uniref:Uncharacterized protein n=1 Tax=Ignisphaera aggregans TaxID=334771 RepID=A0A7J3Z6Q4_9CREN
MNRAVINSIVFFLVLPYLLVNFLLLLIVNSTTSYPDFYCDSTENGDLLYEFFDEFAVLLDEEFNPVKIKFREVNTTRGPIYVYARDLVLGFVEGTEVYDEVAHILGNYSGILVTSMCGLDSVKIEYGCEEDKICIYLPGGPCEFVEKLPVPFRVAGAVYVKSCHDSLRVRVVMNLTLPINEEYAKNVISLIEDNKYSWLADMFRNNTNITAVAEYIIVPVGGAYRVYQYEEEVGFSPFYIAYPRNATEIEEIVTKQVSLHYYGFPLEFEMSKERQFIRKYGNPPEIREVSIIHAYMIAPSVIEKLKDASETKIHYEILWYRPSVGSEDLLTLAIDLLLGKNVTLPPTQAYAYSSSPYDIAYSFEPLLEMRYIYHYPLSIHMPIKAQLVDTSQIITLYLRVDSPKYNNIDPYSIDIGFYEVRREQGLCIQCIIAALLLIGLVLALAVILWRLKRR